MTSLLNHMPQWVFAAAGGLTRSNGSLRVSTEGSAVGGGARGDVGWSHVDGSMVYLACSTQRTGRYWKPHHPLSFLYMFIMYKSPMFHRCSIFGT